MATNATIIQLVSEYILNVTSSTQTGLVSCNPHLTAVSAVCNL